MRGCRQRAERSAGAQGGADRARAARRARGAAGRAGLAAALAGAAAVGAAGAAAGVCGAAGRAGAGGPAAHAGARPGPARSGAAVGPSARALAPCRVPAGDALTRAQSPKYALLRGCQRPQGVRARQRHPPARARRRPGAQVAARGTAALLLFARAEARRGPARRGPPSVLELRLRHLPGAGSGLPPQEVAPRWGGRLLGAAPLPWPPDGAAACAACGGAAGAGPGGGGGSESGGGGDEEVLRRAGGAATSARSLPCLRRAGFPPCGRVLALLPQCGVRDDERRARACPPAGSSLCWSRAARATRRAARCSCACWARLRGARASR